MKPVTSSKFDAAANLHQALAAAIAARDPDAARRCMAQMLDAIATEIDEVVWLFQAGLDEASATDDPQARPALRRRLEDASALFMLD